MYAPAGGAPSRNDFDDLAASSPAARAAAAMRIRRELDPAKLPQFLQFARAASPSVRSAAMDVILDRRDLAVQFATETDPLDSLYSAFAAPAWLRVHPNADGGTLGARETVTLIIDNPGESRFVCCTTDSLSLDDLVCEAVRSRILPYWLVTDPEAPVQGISLQKCVNNVESAVLDPILVAGIPIQACGIARSGDRTLPVFINVGGRPSELPAGFLSRWMHVVRTESGIGAARALAALITLSADPLDAAALAILAARNDPRSTAAMIQGISLAPPRGAGLLAANGAALDAFFAAFLATAPLDPIRNNPAAASRIGRLFVNLPKLDAAGASIDGRLVDLYKSCAPSLKPTILRALHERRAAAAAPIFADAATDRESDVIRALGIEGLDGLAQPQLAAEFLSAISGNPDRETARALVVVARRNPEMRRAAVSRATAGPFWDSAGVEARTSLAEILLISDEATVVEAAIGIVASITDDRAIATLAATIGESVVGEQKARLWSWMQPFEQKGGLPWLLVVALADLAPESQRDRVAAKLLAPGTQALARLAHEAAGRIASAEFVDRHLQELKVAGNAKQRKAGAPLFNLDPGDLERLGWLVGRHLEARPRSAREERISAFTKNGAAAVISQTDLTALLALTGEPMFVTGYPGRSQVAINVNRAPLSRFAIETGYVAPGTRYRVR